MIGALKSIDPIGFLSFAPASAGTNRADVDRRIIQNCPYGRGAAACAGRPVWFRLRRLRENPDRRRSLGRVSEVGRSSAFLKKFIEDFMTKRTLITALLAVGAGIYGTSIAAAADLSVRKSSGMDQIENVVIIYAENRSFDNLYGFFPGANGLQHLTSKIAPQRDRDGLVLKELPPIWDGLTAKGVTPTVTEAQTQHLPNRPFAIDAPNGFNLSLGVATRDLLNLFYQNQMQINRGKNDKFVAYGNSGALVMGHYKNGDKLPLWQIAR